MITALQNFFFKHNKWLFGSLLVVIIVTFVLTIGPQSFFGGNSSRQRESLEYYGYDLSSPADQRALAQAAEVSAILHPELRLNRQQTMDYAYLRLTALGLANQLGIPAPREKELQEYVESISIFQNRQTGEFSSETYNRILQALQGSDRFDRRTMGRVLREDYRIRKVRTALSGPDYTLPFAIKQDYLARETEYDLVLAHLDYNAFSPGLEISEEDLRSFFEENPARYEIPERLPVTALMFNASAYKEDVSEPSEEELRRFFSQNKARYEEALAPEKTAETEDEEETEPEPVTFAMAREEVREDWMEEEASEIAARKSDQFSVRLWREKIKLGSSDYERLIEEFSVRTREIEPFARGNAPSVEEVPQELLSSMWMYSTNPDRYFSDVARISDGAVLLVTEGSTPSRMPSFDEVRDQVRAQYRESEKRRLFAAKGQELRSQFRDNLPDEDFASLAAEAGLEVEDPEPFQGASVPQDLRRSEIWEEAQHLSEGRISNMVINNERGSFAYMASRTEPEIDTDGEQYVRYTQQRQSAIGDTLGWVRLREMTDQNLGSVLGGTVEMP